MPAVQWPLRHGQPMIEVVLTTAQGGLPLARNLLADTGAGSVYDTFELILEENECLVCGGNPAQPVSLGGAYSGSFPVYAIRVQIPALAFDQNVRAVGVPTTPPDLDGIACFRFLSRFSYGNFGDPGQFRLETLPTS